MSDVVIKVEDLSKQYRLGEIGTGSLAHDVNRWWHRIRGKEDPYLKIGEANDRTTSGSSNYVWALRDINFEVKRGEVLGIIGRNGAGKSTLLKILSKTTAPTTGQIKIKGRIASLLEVGTGFHPELSGRDNIFLNGAILGMTKKEIQRKFDEIVDFAGVERYIDTPVKRYSSGMYVRLAFAVAAHLEPEILIVDEVLAVGDAEFQKKCLGKMKDVSVNEGRTVLFVSHNMDSVLKLCKYSIWIDSGSVLMKDYCQEVIKKYIAEKGRKAKSFWEAEKIKDLPFFRSVNSVVKIYDGNILLELIFECGYSTSEKIRPSFVAFDIQNSMGITVMQALPYAMPFINFKNSTKKYKCSIDLTGLIPDKYYISPWIGPSFSETYDFPENIVEFEILASSQEGRTFGYSYDHGFFNPKTNVIEIN